MTYSGCPIDARWPIRSTLPNVAAREAPITTARPGNGVIQSSGIGASTDSVVTVTPWALIESIIAGGASAITSSTPSLASVRATTVPLVITTSSERPSPHSTSRRDR